MSPSSAKASSDSRRKITVNPDVLTSDLLKDEYDDDLSNNDVLSPLDGLATPDDIDTPDDLDDDLFDSRFSTCKFIEFTSITTFRIIKNMINVNYLDFAICKNVSKV